MDDRRAAERPIIRKPNASQRRDDRPARSPTTSAPGGGVRSRRAGGKGCCPDSTSRLGNAIARDGDAQRAQVPHATGQADQEHAGGGHARRRERDGQATQQAAPLARRLRKRIRQPDHADRHPRPSTARTPAPARPSSGSRRMSPEKRTCRRSRRRTRARRRAAAPAPGRRARTRARTGRPACRVRRRTAPRRHRTRGAGGSSSSGLRASPGEAHVGVAVGAERREPFGDRLRGQLQARARRGHRLAVDREQAIGKPERRPSGAPRGPPDRREAGVWINEEAGERPAARAERAPARRRRQHGEGRADGDDHRERRPRKRWLEAAPVRHLLLS